MWFGIESNFHNECGKDWHIRTHGVHLLLKTLCKTILDRMPRHWRLSLCVWHWTIRLRVDIGDWDCGLTLEINIRNTLEIKMDDVNPIIPMKIEYKRSYEAKEMSLSKPIMINEKTICVFKSTGKKSSSTFHGVTFNFDKKNLGGSSDTERTSRWFRLCCLHNLRR